MTEVLHRDAVNVLTNWSNADDTQLDLRRAYLEFLSDHPDGVVRECRVGHITASALVMDESATSVLLTLHPKVGRWLQLGGHLELSDASVRAAALRAVFADMNADTGARLKLVIGAAPFSIASGWNNTLARMSVRVRFRI